MTIPAGVNPAQNPMQSTLQIDLTGNILMTLHATLSLTGRERLVAIFALSFDLCMGTGICQYQTTCILPGQFSGVENCGSLKPDDGYQDEQSRGCQKNTQRGEQW
jgi:hypothetical protein